MLLIKKEKMDLLPEFGFERVSDYCFEKLIVEKRKECDMSFLVDVRDRHIYCYASNENYSQIMDIEGEEIYINSDVDNIMPLDTLWDLIQAGMIEKVED